MAVAVVTDSTAYLPPGMADDLGVRVVPLHVVLGERSGLDGVEVGPARVADALGARGQVSTSRPTIEELAAVYADALRSADAVVAVHLSRELSGTCDAARQAAQQLGAMVHVVDSRSAAMGLGFPVIAAARAARDGGSVDEVRQAAVDVAARCRTFLSVDTLEHLRRGGRVGAAAALLGTALAVKPLLHIQDGELVALEKVRTATRARVRLAELTAQACGDGPASVAVHHLAAAEGAAELGEQLRRRVPGLDSCLVSEVGAAIGAHTGPGMLGTVVVPGGIAP